MFDRIICVLEFRVGDTLRCLSYGSCISLACISGHTFCLAYSDPRAGKIDGKIKLIRIFSHGKWAAIYRKVCFCFFFFLIGTSCEFSLRFQIPAICVCCDGMSDDSPKIRSW